MIKGAIEAMKRGEMILLYDFDDREGETDFAIRSDCVKPSDILRMRKDGAVLSARRFIHWQQNVWAFRLPVISCKI